MPESVEKLEKVGFTKTEQRIAHVLSDGYRHKMDEILQRLEEVGEELAGRSALHAHITRMRKKLVRSEDILCELAQRTTHYRWVILRASASRE